MKKVKMNEKEEAKKELVNLLEKAGWQIYTSTEHVGRDGMMRVVDVFVVVDNTPIHINEYLGALGFKRTKNKNYRGVVIHGVGSDVGYEIVCSLNRKLFGSAEQKIKHRWL